MTAAHYPRMARAGDSPNTMQADFLDTLLRWARESRGRITIPVGRVDANALRRAVPGILRARRESSR